MPRALTSCLAALLLAASAMPSTAQAAPQELDQDEAPTGGITREITDERPYSCPYCDLEGIDLSGRVLTDVNFAGANLRHADLRNTVLKGAMLAGADLTGAQLEGAQLEDSARRATDLSRANLTGADLEGANLDGADLQFATLHGTDFSGIDLTGAVFGPRIKSGWAEGRRTTLRGARLRHEFALDPDTMDLEGVRWQDAARPVSEAVADPVIACGSADLSGLDSRIYVSTSGQDSSTCGTSYSEACRTIEKGIARCSAAGCGVLVAWDEYPVAAPLELRSGIDLYGGCLPESQASPSYFSVVLAAAGGVPAVKARGLSVATVVQGFQLVGSPAA
ncbi:MAG: pentapeptide repeat-containing protein, partial [Acidobacteria bacterium]|nr:pentapeptide repeat-containing protein [Acidobacteriota bacterium]